MKPLMRQINVISRCYTMFRGNKLKELGYDIGTCHHSYLFMLCRSPGLSQDTIAKKMCINKSNVTRHLTQLEKLGYVERKQSNDDKRVWLAYPTQKAFDVIPTLKQEFHEWKESITEGLTEEELELVTEILHKIAKKSAEYAERELVGEDVTE